MKIAKKSLSILMVFVMICSCLVFGAFAASANAVTSWKLSVSNITQTSATVRADVTCNPKRISKIGLMMGTSSKSLKSVAAWSVGSKLTYCSVACDGSEAKSLSSGTTYYYRFYIIRTDKAYEYSSVRNFKTLAPSSSSSNSSSSNAYRWPVPKSTTINGRYGGSHTGIDIAPSGSKTEIVSTKSGTVIHVYSGCKNSDGYSTGHKKCREYGKCNPSDGICSTECLSYGFCNYGYGNGVVVKHTDGTYAMYAHMSSVSVKKNQSVTAGQTLGYMGSSGRSRGTHLHFELSNGINKSGTYYEYKKSINSNPNKISYVY